jgi:allantoinase
MNDAKPHDLVVHGDIALPGGVVLRNGWMGINGGRIERTSEAPLEGREELQATGCLILPGFVDAHVHTRSCVDEGITATTRAAAAGGTTTVIDMPFDKPDRPVNTRERLEAKVADVDAEAVVDVALYATFPPEGDLSIIAELADGGAAGFKVSTIEVDPVRFPRIPDGRLYEAFQEIARTGLPVAAHQENQEIVFSQTDSFRARGDTAPIAHALSRPPVAEAEAAGRLLELAHWTGARLHMVHGTLPRTFDLIAWHREHGVSATGETCLQYLLLTMDALREIGGRAKCNPPLRSQEMVDGLWARLQDGGIDLVTSDHSPYPLHRKETPDIFDAFAGMPGVETLGPLLYSEGVVSGRLGLGRFLDLVAAVPAGVFGLSGKGRREPGADADFVVFDPDAEWTVNDEATHYAVGWSPYHGRAVRGAVVSTWLGGACIYADGEVSAGPGTGRFIRPSRTVDPDLHRRPD